MPIVFLIFFVALSKGEDSLQIPIVTGKKAVGNYSFQTYRMLHQVWENQTIWKSEDKDGKPFSNVFDGVKNQWISKNQVTQGNPHIIELNFQGYKYFKGLIIYPFYTSKSPLTYFGLPTEINLYATIDDTEELKYTIKNNPSPNELWQYILMEFPTTLLCQKMKLEIVEVTPSGTNEYFVQAHDIFFVLDDLTEAYSSGILASDDSYKENKIPPDTYTISSTSTTQTDTSVDNVKTDEETFWAPATELKDTTVNLTFKFEQIQGIESIVMKTSSGGFPYFFKVSTSSAGNPYLTRGIFSIDTSKISDGVFTFKFIRPIWCGNLTIEFIKATEASDYQNKQVPKIQFIYFVQQEEAKSVIRGKPTANSMDIDKIVEAKIPSTAFKNTDTSPSSNDFSCTFDPNGNHWVTSTYTTISYKNYAIYEFNQIECLQSVIFEGAYISSAKRYDGFPYIFKIYASINDAPFELKYVFSDFPSVFSGLVEYNFPTHLWADKLKLEFEETTINVHFSNVPTAAAKSIYLIRTPKEENSPRLEINNTKEEIRSVTIENCTFSDLQDTEIEFGGSIYLTNCEVTCQHNEFTKSHANKGGGAIYINTKRTDQAHSFAFNDLVFTECSSGYGGAICVIALGTSDKVTVTSCEFHSNTANLLAYGGSSIFVATKSTSIKQCTFSGHSGQSSIIRYYKSDPETEGSSSKVLSAADLQLEISDCVFDKDMKVKSSIIDYDEEIDEKSITFKGNQFPSGAIKEIQIQEGSTTKNRTGLLLEILIPSILSIVVLLIAIILIQKIRHNRHENETIQDAHNEP